MKSEAATPVPVGRVVGTKARPNTPHELHFWTPAESAVGIGTLVRVRVAEPRPLEVYGIVVDGAAWTDLQTALHDYLAFEGDPTGGADWLSGGGRVSVPEDPYA